MFMMRMLNAFAAKITFLSETLYMLKSQLAADTHLGFGGFCVPCGCLQ